MILAGLSLELRIHLFTGRKIFFCGSCVLSLEVRLHLLMEGRNLFIWVLCSVLALWPGCQPAQDVVREPKTGEVISMENKEKLAKPIDPLLNNAVFWLLGLVSLSACPHTQILPLPYPQEDKTGKTNTPHRKQNAQVVGLAQGKLMCILTSLHMGTVLDVFNSFSPHHSTQQYVRFTTWQ